MSDCSINQSIAPIEDAEIIAEKFVKQIIEDVKYNIQKPTGQQQILNRIEILRIVCEKANSLLAEDFGELLRMAIKIIETYRPGEEEDDDE